MFRYVLRVETRDEKDHYSPNAASHHSFLRLYAFTTQFVLLLREVCIERPLICLQNVQNQMMPGPQNVQHAKISPVC